MGCTANIIIKDIIHIFASFCKIICILLMGWRNREHCLCRKNGIFLLKCYMDEIHLTHWGWDRMTTIFWKAVSLMKMYEFQLKFHSLFFRVELIIFHHCCWQLLATSFLWKQVHKMYWPWHYSQGNRIDQERKTTNVVWETQCWARIYSAGLFIKTHKQLSFLYFFIHTRTRLPSECQRNFFFQKG